MSKTSSALSKNTTGKPPVNIEENNRIRRFFQPGLRRRFFLDNFLRFLVPCLIPIVILGSLSIFITYRYIGQALDTNNVKVLSQYNEFLQLIVSEIDSLSLTFDTEPIILNTLKRVSVNSSYSLEDVWALRYLKSIIDLPANSKPYIHSIYIYYENKHKRFFSSRENLTYLDSFFDARWLEQYKLQADDSRELITVSRTIREFEHAHSATEVVSIFRPIAGGKGVIVMNIRPQFFERSFAGMRELKDQSIFVMNDDGSLIMRSGHIDPASLAEERVRQSADEDGFISFTVADRLITAKHVPRLDWQLVTVVPRASIYGPLYVVTQITIVLSLCSVLISILLAIWLTRKNYRQVYSIIDTLNSADHGHAKPSTNKVEDIYELIIQNILDTFLQQKYLKVQLSERKYKEQALEFKALQAQINPHFLNNTLHSIYWKSIDLTRSPNTVSQMIEYLSDMLDYAVRTSDELVPLEEELLYNKNYVRIQQMGYPDRIKMTWGSIEGLESTPILKLSLQPLLENSISHGLENREKLNLKVNLRMQDQCLRLTVLDDGGGISRERLAEIDAMLASDEERTDHVGLLNTYRRLRLKYGDQAGVRILSKHGVGTSVSIWFPIHKGKE
jgi:two-component system sensor histidine kinase YesM